MQKFFVYMKNIICLFKKQKIIIFFKKKNFLIFYNLINNKYLFIFSGVSKPSNKAQVLNTLQIDKNLYHIKIKANRLIVPNVIMSI